MLRLVRHRDMSRWFRLEVTSGTHPFRPGWCYPDGIGYNRTRDMNPSRGCQRSPDSKFFAQSRQSGPPLSLSMRLVARMGLLCGTTLSSLGPAAHAAEPSGSAETANPRASAREAFQRGVLLSQQGRFAEARDSFWAAFALNPHGLSSYNAALASRALGDLQGALAALDVTLARPSEELSSEERASVARERLEVTQLLGQAMQAAPSDVAPTTPHLQLSCDLSQVEVSAGGKLLLVTRAGTGAYSIAVPQGVSSLTLTRPGYTRQTIDVSEPDARCALTPLPARAVVATTSELPESPNDTREPSNLPYWVGGAGVALAAAGAGIWLYDNQRYSQWRDSDLGDDRDQLRESILLWDKLALCSTAAGGALLLAGGIVYWSNRPTADRASASRFLVGPASVHFTHTW